MSFLATSFVLIFHFVNSHYINMTLVFKAKTKNKIINPKTSIYFFTVPNLLNLLPFSIVLSILSGLVIDRNIAVATQGLIDTQRYPLVYYSSTKHTQPPIHLFQRMV